MKLDSEAHYEHIHKALSVLSDNWALECLQKEPQYYDEFKQIATYLLDQKHRYGKHEIYLINHEINIAKTTLKYYKHYKYYAYVCNCTCIIVYVCIIAGLTQQPCS